MKLESTKRARSVLSQGNDAYRNRNYLEAIQYYIESLLTQPSLAIHVGRNIEFASKKYRQKRQLESSDSCKVVVSGWDLTHNAAGRVTTLAQLYQGIADVTIVGCEFCSMGRGVWSPIKNLGIDIYTISIGQQSEYIQKAIKLVSDHPCDLLHMSKPRMPNIIIGLLYKLIWKARVIVDIDDEELAFVEADNTLSIDEYLDANAELPALDELTGKVWTQIAVGLVKAFDGITVVNPALQKVYGGTLVRHARDESMFTHSCERRINSRKKLNIGFNQKVVLFLGTPRDHKGLLETARAIAELGRDDVLYLIVGDFPKGLERLKVEIEQTKGLDSRFIGNQPFEKVPDIIAVADCCVLLQDFQSRAAQYQTPAKLSDALAMGILVLAENTLGLDDLGKAGAFRPVNRNNLTTELNKALGQDLTFKPHSIFLEKLSLDTNRGTLITLLAQNNNIQATTISPILLQLGAEPIWGELLNALTTDTSHDISKYNKSIAGSNLNRISYQEAIQKAQRASSYGKWALAYKYWINLYYHQKDSLPIEALVLISRELFQLDAFSDASQVLQTALNREPSNTNVLCLKAEQYFYHCYSSWLMNVAENELDWHLIDGGSERPTWMKSVELFLEAEKKWTQHSSNFIQAHLLLAEEAWHSGNKKQFRCVIFDVLGYIGTGSLDKEMQGLIVRLAESFKENGNSKTFQHNEKVLRKKLEMLSPSLFSVADWLLLSDILNWNGLLLCGHIVKELSIDEALSLAENSSNNSEYLKTGIKAALERSESVLAQRFLGQLKRQSQSDDVKALEAYIGLQSGNVDKFRNYWPYPQKTIDKAFREYIQGKRVAIVGPAPSEELNGKEIDGHDIVIRINYRGDDRLDEAAVVGRKTHISLYNAHTVRLLNNYPIEAIKKLEFVLVRRPISDSDSFFLQVKNLRQIQENHFLLYKSANAVPALLFDLMLCNAGSIGIYNVNFYLGKKHHHSLYRQGDDVSNDKALLYKNIQSVMTHHSLVTQRVFCHHLLSDKVKIKDNNSSDLNKDPLTYLSQLLSNDEMTGNNKIEVSNTCKKIENFWHEKFIEDKSDKKFLSKDKKKPVSIILNGPSASRFDRNSLSKDSIIARANFFFLEDEKKYGNVVDYYFFAVNQEPLNEGLASIIDKGDYSIGNIINCVSVSDINFKNESTPRSSLLKYPFYDQWKTIMKNEELGRYIVSRPLPTSGVQIIAFFAVLGYREFDIVGMDFYQGSRRHLFKHTDEIKNRIDDKHYTPGYEKGAHELDVDISFFIEILKQYPDIKINNIANNEIIDDVLSGKRKQKFLYENPKYS